MDLIRLAVYMSQWLSHGEWVMATLTLIYVVITGIYVRISYRTLKAIERQEATQSKANAEQINVAQINATAAKLSADAAKDTADGLIGSERAWILTEVRPPAQMSLLQDVSSTRHNEPEINSTVVTCLLILRNQGKTPALNVQPLLRSEILDEMPKTLNFDDRTIFEGSPVFIQAVAPDDERLLTFTLRCTGRRQQNQIIIVYGLVTYKDIFGKSRQTRLCYRIYGLNDILPVNVPEFNKVN